MASCSSIRSHILKVLERFSMQNSKPVSTPLAAHFRLSAELSPQSENEEKYMSQVPYSSAIGSLMYAMYVLVLIFYMQLVSLVAIWGDRERHIGRL